MKRTYIALAPIRICDLGGWADTWFAKHGTVLNIAVSPREMLREINAPGGGIREIGIRLDDAGLRLNHG